MGVASWFYSLHILDFRNKTKTLCYDLFATNDTWMNSQWSKMSAEGMLKSKHIICNLIQLSCKFLICACVPNLLFLHYRIERGGGNADPVMQYHSKLLRMSLKPIIVRNVWFKKAFTKLSSVTLLYLVTVFFGIRH